MSVTLVLSCLWFAAGVCTNGTGLCVDDVTSFMQQDRSLKLGSVRSRKESDTMDDTMDSDESMEEGSEDGSEEGAEEGAMDSEKVARIIAEVIEEMPEFHNAQGSAPAATGAMPGAVPPAMPGAMGTMPGAMPGVFPGAMPGYMPGAMLGATGMPGAMGMPNANPGSIPGVMMDASGVMQDVAGMQPTMLSAAQGAPMTMPAGMPAMPAQFAMPGAFMQGTMQGAMPGTLPSQTMPGAMPAGMPGAMQGSVPPQNPAAMFSAAPGAPIQVMMSPPGVPQNLYATAYTPYNPYIPTDAAAAVAAAHGQAVPQNAMGTVDSKVKSTDVQGHGWDIQGITSERKMAGVVGSPGHAPQLPKHHKAKKKSKPAPAPAPPTAVPQPPVYGNPYAYYNPYAYNPYVANPYAYAPYAQWPYIQAYNPAAYGFWPTPVVAVDTDEVPSTFQVPEVVLGQNVPKANGETAKSEMPLTMTSQGSEAGKMKLDGKKVIMPTSNLQQAAAVSKATLKEERVTVDPKAPVVEPIMEPMAAAPKKTAIEEPVKAPEVIPLGF
jgi:hypothetical protein